MDELIDEGELSQRLGVAPATLKVWRVRGQGPKYVKVGERVRYSVTDVQTWVESRKVTPGKVVAETIMSDPNEVLVPPLNPNWSGRKPAGGES